VAHETTCQVAFRGNFTPASVQLGWAAVSGPYRAAIVVVRLSDREVVATVLFQSVPGSLHFGHRFA
jgi:ABC-type thiamin/hydroxymethylpyrimidine transport system permease subunit